MSMFFTYHGLGSDDEENEAPDSLAPKPVGEYDEEDSSRKNVKLEQFLDEGVSLTRKKPKSATGTESRGVASGSADAMDSTKDEMPETGLEEEDDEELGELVGATPAHKELARKLEELEKQKQELYRQLLELSREDDKKKGNLEAPSAADPASASSASASSSSSAADDEAVDPLDSRAALANAGSVDGHVSQEVEHWFVERARYIPVRLAYNERKHLRLLVAALGVSEYTDKVDIVSYSKSKTARIHAQLEDICAILSGLVVACDYRAGQKLLKDKNFEDNEEFFQTLFELGRRYKIMNPDKMRSEYGKLMYLLMDSQSPHIQDLLGFSLVTPINTVYNFLEERDALAVLRDEHIRAATMEIKSHGKSRHEVQAEIYQKERAVKYIANRYQSARISKEELETVLYSIGDNHAYLGFNRDPIDQMITWLKRIWQPKTFDEGRSLAIQAGRGGARLTHSHERQYYYVLQSLILWRLIMNDMFKLWYLAESDLLRAGNRYRLSNTGQGLNRVQPAPATYRAIAEIVNRAQGEAGFWVGSSVIHMGDHNVPNSFMFIDKYNQVPRILNPIVLVIKEIPNLAKDPKIKKYFDDAFGSPLELQVEILGDFFRYGFDGSGADNFFDSGSCIDGRLTSAWNWCSKLEKKRYYPVFKLAGFQGFDGEFRE
mmetsp:Transcript_4564/g.13951  ORF Transcript_4564/g.13951 Transcript_4564/m.13951 type:complete len:661 (-) Transcript_4564:37-2019(-)